MTSTAYGTYQPRYVEEWQAVPMAGATEEYSEEEIRTALKHAEQAWLETDVNEGQKIPQDHITQAHKTAANAIATFILATGLVHPNSVRGGDLSNDGERRARYADQFRQIYRDRIAEILNLSPGEIGDGGGGSGGGGDGTVSKTPFQIVTY